MKYRTIKIILSTFVLPTILIGQQERKSVFDGYTGFKFNSYKNNDLALYKIISEKASKLLDVRTVITSEFETKAHWLTNKEGFRDKLSGSIKKLKRTSLNSKVTRIIKRKYFKVEKVIFESEPGICTTECLFIPKESQRPVHVIIYCSGHLTEAFRGETYQNVILNLGSKGFDVLAYNSISQGERSQYFNIKTCLTKIGFGTPLALLFRYPNRRRSNG